MTRAHSVRRLSRWSRSKRKVLPLGWDKGDGEMGMNSVSPSELALAEMACCEW